MAQAFIIGESHIGGHESVLVLGDNIFYAERFSDLLQQATQHPLGATVFGYHVANPGAYGVAEFNPQGKVINIEEKPLHP